MEVPIFENVLLLLVELPFTVTVAFHVVLWQKTQQAEKKGKMVGGVPNNSIFLILPVKLACYS